MSIIAVCRHQNVKPRLLLLIKVAKKRPKKFKTAAKSKPQASKCSFTHILIKEGMEQIDLKDRGLGSTHMVRPASERDPILLLKMANL